MPPLRSTGAFPGAEQPEQAGQYRLEECLGHGGMGVVHLASSASGLRLAVKVVHAEHAADPEFRARFRQEVAAARRVSGAFTAPVVDADPEAPRPWMATLFIEGPTLAEEVKGHGPLDSARLRRVGAGLAEALRDIHRAGVVHRDLKPGNVLLAQDGPKVIDFGISRPRDSELRTETGKLIGTPPFMAPEQFQRPREVGPAADVFALGAVLVHAATGRGPFDSDSPYIVAYQVVHDDPDLTGVPDDLVPLLHRCLAKDPADRPSPYEVMVALRAASPSAAHDTQAHIPAQRGPGADSAAARPVAGSGEAQGDDGPTAAERQAHTPRRSRPRRRAVRLASAACAVAAAAVAFSVAAPGDRGGGSPAPAANTADDALRPWSVPLREASGSGIPACTASAAAVFCTAPGVTAVRLEAGDGRTAWTAGAHTPTSGGEAPVLSGGLLQVPPSGGGRHRALDPESGEVRWERDASGYAAVRVVGGLVLLVSADGGLEALDAATGAERWTARGRAGAQWVASPGGPLLAVAPSADGSATTVGAVAPDDGRPLWERRLDGLLSPVEPAGPVLHLLASDLDGFTDAVVRLELSGADGFVTRVPLDAPVDQAQAAAHGDTVHVTGAGGSLIAVDTAAEGGQGAQSWRLETSAARLSRPAAGAGAVFVSSGDGRLLAVDAARGTLVGQSDPRMHTGPNTFSPRLPAPVLAGGRVHATAPDGSVFALDAAAPGGW
ncbi:PQQ-binding-like beta-propeller repeat protein [Streptomyces sp. NPDC090026]|uniref:protein kinase domain-containing protein n=1 Tax=Streptomyces sp. NPDC090026 TaxID=3365923 RepID=UPI003809FEE0